MLKDLYKKFWHRFIEGDKDDRETEFLPSILEVTETPPSPVGRAVLWTIVALLVIGGIWVFWGQRARCLWMRYTWRIQRPP